MRTHLTTDCRLALETGLEAPLELEPSRAPFQLLKRLMRSTSISLEHPIRSRLWTQMALRHCNRADTQFDAQFEIRTNKLPHFVEPRVARFFALDSSGRREVTTVLWHLSQSNQNLFIYLTLNLFIHQKPVRT